MKYISAILLLCLTANAGPIGFMQSLPQPIRWFTFNDGTGNQVTDWSGRNAHAYRSNTPAWLSTGVAGGSMAFNGVNQYVALTNSSDLFPSQLTVSFWYYRTNSMNSLDWQFVWAKNPNDFASVGWFVTSDHSGGISLGLELNGSHAQRAYSTTAPNTLFASNAWTHAVLVYNGAASGYFIYTNGVETDKTIVGSSPAITANSFNVTLMGITGYGVYRPGYMDDFRIYNVALTAEQVRQLYNGGRATQK